MTTAVPPVQITPTGVVLPTEAAVLAGSQADINTAFGGGVNPALNTPQGQIASSQAAIIGEGNNQFALYVNQVDPAFAAGRMQDGIGRIYFIERLPSQPTAVQCVVVGSSGTVIPAAWPVGRDTAGNIYLNATDATIPSGGSLTIGVANQVAGPIACPAGTLSQVYKAIPGLDTITNPADGVLGRDTENRADFEFRRQQSVAKNGQGSLPSIYGNVLEVPGVLDAYAYENWTGAPISVGSSGYVLAPHSIYVGAAGGDADAVGQAIWTKKAPGANFNGATTVTVYDTVNYSTPYPAYSITFQTLAPTPVFMSVQLINSPGVPSNYATLVQNALLSAFAGGDGGARARAGSQIGASRYYPPVIAALPPGVLINDFFVGLAASPTQTSVTMGIDQTPTLSAGNIVVTTT